MVIIATLFHTSAIVFLIVPIIDLIARKLKGRIIFISLISCLILAMSIVGLLFSAITTGGSEDSFLGSYEHLSDAFGNSNL